MELIVQFLVLMGMAFGCAYVVSTLSPRLQVEVPKPEVTPPIAADEYTWEEFIRDVETLDLEELIERCKMYGVPTHPRRVSTATTAATNGPAWQPVPIQQSQSVWVGSSSGGRYFQVHINGDFPHNDTSSTVST